MKIPHIETDCVIEFQGRKFEAGGAIVTADRIIAYPAADGILCDWHGNAIGAYAQTRPLV